MLFLRSDFFFLWPYYCFLLLLLFCCLLSSFRTLCKDCCLIWTSSKNRAFLHTILVGWISPIKCSACCLISLSLFSTVRSLCSCRLLIYSIRHKIIVAKNEEEQDPNWISLSWIYMVDLDCCRLTGHTYTQIQFSICPIHCHLINNKYNKCNHNHNRSPYAWYSLTTLRTME